MKIGFIGIGAMGKPMARRLMAASYELFVCNQVATPAEELAAEGAVKCDSAAEVGAQADVTFMSLPNAEAVSQVVSGVDGLLSTAAPGSVIIDLSSVDPGCSKRLAAEAAEKGIAYLDAPVSGGVGGAASGSLTIMVGGEDEVLARVRPLLDILGKKIVHVGDVGAGDAIKIVNNMILGANMAILAEALVLGKKLGLSGAVMSEIIGQGSGRSYVLDAKLEKFILGDDFTPGFAVDLQHKDLGLALDAATSVKMPVPMAGLARQLYAMASARGLGRMDMSVIVKIWEDLAGVTIKD